MKKLFYYLLLLSLLLGLLGCSTVNKQTNQASESKGNLYVQVVNSSGKSLAADSIILLNQSGKMVNYYRNKSEVKLAKVNADRYRVVVAKEEYELYKSSLFTAGNKTGTLRVELNQQDNTVPVKIDVCSQAGKKLSEVQVQVFKDGKLKAEKIASEGRVVFDDIWPGVFYQYKFKKCGYTTYQNVFFTLAEKSDYLQVSLQEGKKQIFTDEAKKINLGTLAQGESAVVAVSPLDINYTITYDASVAVNFIARQQSKLQVPRTKRNFNRQQAVQASSKQHNLAQQKISNQLRKLEKNLLSEQASQQLRKQLVSTNQITSTQLGDTRKFKVGDLSNPEQITATLQGQGEHVSVFVADKVSIKQKDIDRIVSAFDNQIYSSNMKYFAQHSYNYYDKDHNGRSIILITDLGGSPENMVLGYFHPIDYKSSQDYPRSNEADMFYINSKLLKYIREGEFDFEQHLLSTLAHEFQHLIFYMEKLLSYNSEVGGVNDVWINEGFSGLAEYLSGYYQYKKDNRITSHYFNQPAQESVLLWNNELSDYGASNLFALYLYDQFGSEIVKQINTTYKPPAKIIASQSRRNFSELLLDWSLTNYISDLQPENNRYSYAYPDNFYHDPIKLEAKPDYGYRKNEVITESSNFEFDIESTGVKYYKIKGDGRKVSVDFNFPVSLEQIGVIIYK